MGTLDSYDDSVRLPYLNFNNKRDFCDECVAADVCGFTCYQVNFAVHGDIHQVSENICWFKRTAFLEAMRVDRVLRRERNALYLRKVASYKSRPSRRKQKRASSRGTAAAKPSTPCDPGETWSVHI